MLQRRRLALRDQLTLALLVGVGSVLHLIEGMLPPLPLPGVKLGLANVATLLALRLLGARASVAVAVLRSLLGALLGGTLFSPAFWMGFFGALSSALVMSGMVAIRPRGSNALTSVLGAVAHSTAQIITVIRIMRHPGLWGYWPFLTLASGVTGFFVGLVTDRSLTLTKGWLTNRKGAL